MVLFIVIKQFSDIILPHFTTIGGSNSNYYYAIYRILIKLRVHFIYLSTCFLGKIKNQLKS